jgi:hypothetical protein
MGYNQGASTLRMFPGGLMSIHLDRVVRALCVLALVAVSGSLEAQPRRVAGVSVTVGDVRPGGGGGQEADLTVQVTTLQETGTSVMRGGERAAVPSKTQLAYGGQLGDLRVTYAYGPYVATVSPYTFSTFIPPTQTLGNINLSGTVQISFLYRLTIDGALPGIDYGDGATIPATLIPQVSSATTVGGATRRVFRGSFTHTYATPGTYTVRVASACCPGTGTTPYAGTPVTAGAYPAQVRYVYSSILRYNLTGTYSLQYINSTVPSTRTVGPYPAPTGTYTYTYPYTTPFSTSGYPVQMVNSAIVPPFAGAVLTVPVEPGALLFLASLLALAGFFVLRRRG